jgi:Flp pilus assembly protein TadD
LDCDLTERAITLLEELVDCNSGSEHARIALAEAYEAVERHASALEQLRLAALHRETAPTLILLGIAASRLGQGEAAERAFRRSLELEPDNEEAMLNLALSVRGKDVLEAARLLERAVAIDPKYETALSELGYTYWRQQRLGDAKGVLRASLELNSAQPWALAYLAAVLQDLGDLAEAESAIRLAIKQSPTWAYPEHFLGTLQQRAGRTDDARRHFETAVALDEDDSVSAFKYASFLFTCGEPGPAEKWLRRTIELEPGHAAALGLLRRIDGERD